MALGHRKLSCFYCGARSAEKWNGGAQQWRCQACEAINYLDKKGQITDPPAQASPLPKNLIRFARPTSATLSGDASSSDQIFCSTCLKNQHIVKESLASYLPPENSAEYDEYVAKYESYRGQLEARYPQVCLQCAPRAREQIRKASYVAKTDHLRRMIDRTKTSDTSSKRQNIFITFCIKIGGFGYRASALFQASWHGLMVLSLFSQTRGAATFDSASPVLGQDDSTTDSLTWTFLEKRVLRKDKMRDLTGCMPIALLAALLTIWWNPRLRARQLQTGGKLEGLTHYYVSQIISLLLRAAAFTYLEAPPQILRVDILRGLHGFTALFIISTLMVSVNTIQLNTKPLFTFPAQDQPILPDITQPEPENYPAQSFNRIVRPAGASSFPIANLAPTPLSKPSFNDPSTPDPEDEPDPDSMDWTPSAKPSALSLNPSQRTQQTAIPHQGPSPFHGTLPPAPIAPSHKLRNPNAYQPGTFRKATEAQQTTFAANTSTTPLRRSTRKTRNSRAANSNIHSNPYDSDETDLTAEDDDAASSVAGSTIFSGRRGKHRMELAEPKFFPQEDMRDTGLEDMFGTSFGLQDAPAGLDAKPGRPSQAASPGWFGWSRQRKTKGM